MVVAPATAFLLKFTTTLPGHLLPGPGANDADCVSARTEFAVLPAMENAVAAAEVFRNDRLDTLMMFLPDDVEFI
jgi:hypothetical protein